ncbi:23S rRNA and tRNA pseudouridine synthase [Campylobacter iguaniorum]|uniref:RNA pseudouridylate synthase n=1 Tax=Campylobacter iguaniorum TaxID=1244531 RepID=A0A076FAS3_9BACT|nr:RluA family pseudouridine synthase [Campylobacter iguaniorum]AII14587.1 23S rRNA and tRNA pseudouridine synthase [Campylobacter iguaniorum]ALV24322.1 23S rRNA and tRNA pseudouridine synthase [Campylobacter iguaniorum]ANE35742.1 23S rRNA and tRNA pseudouridine synthase [Campylobacter iguaniorum]
MKEEKAYKLLALQEGISNNEAKELIDAGLVSARGQKIVVARGMLSDTTTFKVMKIAKPTKIFEDENIIAVNKPPFVISEKVAEMFKFPLLNRLDKETSGVVLLYKNEEFQQKAIKEFANNKVDKTYLAIVRGIVVEDFSVELPITTVKMRSGAFSKIDLSRGKTAITHVSPLMVEGKKSFIKVVIETGRTHQIRCHLAHAGFGVIGDEKYAKNSSKRMYLHSYEISLLGYKFRAPLDRSFSEFGFEIPKEYTK